MGKKAMYLSRFKLRWGLSLFSIFTFLFPSNLPAAVTSYTEILVDSMANPNEVDPVDIDGDGNNDLLLESYTHKSNQGGMLWVK